jgi:hypothetical protein
MKYSLLLPSSVVGMVRKNRGTNGCCLQKRTKSSQALETAKENFSQEGEFIA